jgi:hypothetical protein
MLKDIEIHRIFGIPIQTLSDWKKKSEDNWRYMMYFHLSSMDREFAKKEVELFQLKRRQESEFISLRQLQMAS